MISGTLVFMIGMGALDSIQRQAVNEHEIQVLQQFDHDLTSLTNDTTKSVYLKEGQYDISNTSTIYINSSNGFEEISNLSVTMGTLVQDGESGTELGYQAGGIWRNNGGSTTVVSRPDLRYYKDGDLGRIDFSITSLTGNAGSGENIVTQQNSSRPSVDTPSGDEFVSHVEITVEGTRYHDGWYEFMSDEFEATDIEDEDRYPKCDFEPDVTFDRNRICHDPSNRTVTVIATVDGNNPFAHHVGIDPTIYGGLSADSIDDSNYGDDLNVSGYSNDNRSNTSSDLFTVNSNVNLKDGADVEGYPVLNGEIYPKAEATVDPIAYVSDPAFETRDAERRYWTNDTRVAHLTDSVIAANMSRPFDPHENIDDEINDGALGYLKNNVDKETVEEFDNGKTEIGEAGRYYTSASDFDLEEVDTSGGNVHIGVGGSGTLALSNLEVSGGNQTYIYTNKSATIDGDGVSAKNDASAETFWLYGTSDASITIKEAATFEGVVYAPENDLEIEDNAKIVGAVVGGKTDIGDNVRIKFDRSIRTEIPIPEENRDITVEEARAPLDVTFVLDGSGSMGGSASTVTGGDWQNPPFDSGIVASDANHSLEVDQCGFFGGCSIETIDPGESYSDSFFQDIEEVRVKDGSESDSVIVKDPSRGSESDPLALRADATRDFIEALNESNNDRAGVFEFNSGSETVRELDSDLSNVRNSISVSANGGTNMSKGMGAALSQYSDSSDNKRVMVLLSDGENDLGDETERANDMTRQLINKSANKSVTIYTIGLGNDVDTTLLKKAANKTDGKYYHADDAEKLEDLFDRIAERVIADAEITFDVGGIPDPGEASSDYVVNVETRQVRIEN